MTLNALRSYEVQLSTLKDHPHCILIFQIYHMDYRDQDFTKLKYSNASAPIIRKDQFYLDLHTNFISIWLYPVFFHHCIRNTDSLALKYSELLASYYDDLRSKRYLCPYAPRAALDSRVLSKWVTCSIIMYSFISSVCHTSISTLLD